MNTVNFKQSNQKVMTNSNFKRKTLYPFNRAITFLDCDTNKMVKRFITSRQYNY